MKVQWKIGDAADQWIRYAAEMYGYSPGAFITYWVRYAAGDLEDWESEAFGKFLSVAQERIEVDFNEEEEEES